MYYNNKKAGEFRLFGLLLLFYIFYFYCVLLIVFKPELTTKFINIIYTVYTFFKIF